ncbi:hypothetical protein PIB19_08355 [Sphingomonas sp. 7/4-4]|uniref:hypothetical protein n=1 Tax=Sphingomonas sp. 7/4-4 TaxID=3018446 RepID=UPI0022F37F81|nr:hypothetical protein [Sphingomonas sp. 7/4-4]WBY09308.1 hypothetical protein PIB19_08355 [Sphingomonas sp. 7/4-4]
MTVKLPSPDDGAHRCAIPTRPCVHAMTRRGPPFARASGAITMPVTWMGWPRSFVVQYSTRQARMPGGAVPTGRAAISVPARCARAASGDRTNNVADRKVSIPRILRIGLLLENEVGVACLSITENVA